MPKLALRKVSVGRKVLHTVLMASMPRTCNFLTSVHRKDTQDKEWGVTARQSPTCIRKCKNLFLAEDFKTSPSSDALRGLYGGDVRRYLDALSQALNPQWPKQKVMGGAG